MKDQSLQAVLASRRGLEAGSVAQAQGLDALYLRAHEEIAQWMSLADNMSRRIEAMKQHCSWCGVSLSAQAANTKCRGAGAAQHGAGARGSQLGLHAFVPTAHAQADRS